MNRPGSPNYSFYNFNVNSINGPTQWCCSSDYSLHQKSEVPTFFRHFMPYVNVIKNF